MSTKVNLKSAAKKRIESPLAKYNGAGQLFCVLCNAQVKNEIYWTGHVNGKAHKENLSNLKKGNLPPPAVPVKRSAPVESHEAPDKKVQKVESSVRKAEEELQRMIEEKQSRVPIPEPKEEEEKTPEGGPLPAGFFDDPVEDAKARGQKFRDPQDVEWDKFVREMASEEVKSSEIVGEEQEKSAVHRELDHLEEQMAQWQRVIELEKKAEEYTKQRKNASTSKESPAPSTMDVDSEEEEEEDLDLDDIGLDNWRNKKKNV